MSRAMRLAAALGLGLSGLAPSACSRGEPAPDDAIADGVPADEPVGEAQQPVLVCQGGGAAYQIACYNDADGDGWGVGAKVNVWVCSGNCLQHGYALSGGDCDDSSAARFQYLMCYPDADGDHFGVGPKVSTCAGDHCAAGTTGAAYNSGDCDDSNPAIHPQRLETNEDGIDNDCENGVDQAEFFFDHPDVSANATTSIQMTVRLRQGTERAAALAGSLSAKIYYKKLAESSAGWHVYPASGTTPMTIPSCTAGGLCKASVTLPGLDPLTVYAADLELYNTQSGARIYPYGKNAQSSECGFLTPLSRCFNTDRLYSMTRGEPGPLRDARWGIVMTALDRYGLFRNTDMGYWSSELKYELEMKANDTAYCSEFYAAAAKDYLIDMNPCDYQSAAATPQCDPGETTDAERYVPYLKTWFGAYGASQSYEYAGPDMSALKPGDWLGVNPTAAEPDGGHTQMFLAWEDALDRYWFVEGNGSITATWNANPNAYYDHSINVDQHHHCDDGAPTNATCGSSDYYVQRVGKLSVPMVDP